MVTFLSRIPLFLSLMISRYPYIIMYYTTLYDHVFQNMSELDRIKENHITLLGYLTKIYELSNDLFLSHLATIHHIGQIIVAVDGSTIVGTGTIILEPKLSRGGLYVGHIEDVVVHPEYRGKRIAQDIITRLKEYGDQKKCYKIVLNCASDMVPFYEKVGFTEKGIHLADYLD